MPRATSFATSSVTSSRMLLAIALPSIKSAGKVHRPLLANDHDLDLPRVLQLGLDAARNLLAQRGHAKVVHVIRIDDHPDLSPGLNGEDLVDTGIARRDPFEALEALHVGLERLTPRAG